YFKEKPTMGYCIRTGEKIPFNPEKPFSAKAFAEWSKFKNPHYKENYCHQSGVKSYGKTSFAKPVIAKDGRE
ncbi:MAG: hypothetical protein ACK5F0_04165, partial [Flavobacteriales bacterium]